MELSGGTLASVPLGSVAEERYGAPYLTFHRADLHAALLSTCKGLGAIDLRDGFEVTEVESIADGVIATGADGMQVEGSSLIAADGIWSSLRDHIEPHAGLRFSGATAWRALLPRDQVPAPFDAPGVGLWLGPRAHIVHYPVRGGKDVNIVAVVEGGSAKQGWDSARGTRRPVAGISSLGKPGSGAARECRELALLVAVPIEAIAPLDERARGPPR